MASQAPDVYVALSGSNGYAHGRAGTAPHLGSSLDRAHFVSRGQVRLACEQESQGAAPLPHMPWDSKGKGNVHLLLPLATCNRWETQPPGHENESNSWRYLHQAEVRGWGGEWVSDVKFTKNQ